MEMRNQHHAPGLLPREKKKRYALIRRLGREGSTSGVDDLEKKSLAPTGIATHIFQPAAYTDYTTPTPQLACIYNKIRKYGSNRTG